MSHYSPSRLSLLRMHFDGAPSRGGGLASSLKVIEVYVFNGSRSSPLRVCFAIASLRRTGMGVIRWESGKEDCHAALHAPRNDRKTRGGDAAGDSGFDRLKL